MADFLGISCLCATMKFMSTFKPTSLLDKVFEGGIILRFPRGSAAWVQLRKGV